MYIFGYGMSVAKTLSSIFFINQYLYPLFLNSKKFCLSSYAKFFNKFQAWLQSSLNDDYPRKKEKSIRLYRNHTCVNL